MIAGDPVGFFPAELRLLPGMEGHANLYFYDCPEELFASGCRAGLLFSHDRIVPAKRGRDIFFPSIRGIWRPASAATGACTGP